MAGVWREEGLKLSMKQLKRGRLWFIDGSCVQLRSVFKHQIRSDDFVADRTQDGRPLRILTLIDEYRREFTAMKVRRNFKAQDVVEAFLEQFLKIGLPSHLRSDICMKNGNRSKGISLSSPSFSFLSGNQIGMEATLIFSGKCFFIRMLSHMALMVLSLPILPTIALAEMVCIKPAGCPMTIEGECIGCVEVEERALEEPLVLKSKIGITVKRTPRRTPKLLNVENRPISDDS